MVFGTIPRAFHKIQMSRLNSWPKFGLVRSRFVVFRLAVAINRSLIQYDHNCPVRITNKTMQISQFSDDCALLICEMFDYWVSMYSSEDMPGRRHFDPIDIMLLSSNLWLVDVERDPLRFFIRRVGMEIDDFTGHYAAG